jgi:hypothetical protein
MMNNVCYRFAATVVFETNTVAEVITRGSFFGREQNVLLIIWGIGRIYDVRMLFLIAL